MDRVRKRRRSKRDGLHRRAESRPAAPHDPLEDVFEAGGQLFLAVGYTPGGAPFGPRVEIVNGELVFPDEPPVDIDPTVEPEDEGPPAWDSPSAQRESPF
jgi:hypothetical protein